MRRFKPFFICVFLMHSLYALASEPVAALQYNVPANIAKVSKPWYLEDFRFGFGVGYGLYVTNQMDYEITTNYGDYKELVPTYFGAIYKQVNPRLEMGVQARFGNLLTLKSDNTQGTRCNFSEVQLSAVYSFTGDVNMERRPFTVNGIFSLGVTNFRSQYFEIDPRTLRERMIAQVGYGGLLTDRNQPGRQTAIIGNTGFALGYRFARSFSIYWENTFNLSTSNKMTGNLAKRSWIPTDGYFYSSVGLYIRFGTKRGMLSCPKF